MLLHGVYENGIVTFLETELPKIKTNFVIQIEDNESTKPTKYKKLKGLWKDKNIPDTTSYLSKLRKLIESRSL